MKSTSVEEQNGRPGCIPVSENGGECFFPPLPTSMGSRSTTSSLSDSPDSRDFRGMKRRGSTTFPSPSLGGGSSASSPTKLPQIDRSKSNSVSSLTSNNSSLKRLQRSAICRSPSCPSLWYSEDDDIEPKMVQRGDLGASIHPSMSKRANGQLKLPDIFGGSPPSSKDSTRSSGANDLNGLRFMNKKASFSLPTTEPEIALNSQKSPRTQPGLLLPMNAIRDKQTNGNDRKCPRRKKKRKDSMHGEDIPENDLGTTELSSGSPAIGGATVKGLVDWELGGRALTVNANTEDGAIEQIAQENRVKNDENGKPQPPERSHSDIKCREWLAGMNKTNGNSESCAVIE